MAPTYVSDEEVKAQIERRAMEIANEISDRQIEELAKKVSLDSTWHLDKRLPVGIIFAVLVQTVGFIAVGTAWKVGIESRIDLLEQHDSDRAPQEARLIRVEERLSNIADILRRIERKMEVPTP